MTTEQTNPADEFLSVRRLTFRVTLWGDVLEEYEERDHDPDGAFVELTMPLHQFRTLQGIVRKNRGPKFPNVDRAFHAYAESGAELKNPEWASLCFAMADLRKAQAGE